MHCVSDRLESLEDNIREIAESDSIDRMHDKLNSLLKDSDREEQVRLAVTTLDKFDDYMKNVDKLNGMINEFKGCVSVARSAIEDRKTLDKQTEETRKLAEISQEIYKSMRNFIKASETIEQRAHFKIDAIYKALCENQEEKSPKKSKSVKKKASQAP